MLIIDVEKQGHDNKKIVSMIKKEIVSLKRSSKFVNYYDSDSLADRLHDLRLSIVGDLNAKSPKIAFEMMLDFLDLHKNTLERVDDSNGKIANWGTLQNHEEYLKVIKTKHKRKVSFWAEYKSALQKKS